jgi:hypothetical protein
MTYHTSSNATATTPTTTIIEHDEEWWWSELALRARATQVAASAALYAAKPFLSRGPPVPTHAKVFLPMLARFVHSDAIRAHTTHLVSGWRQSDDVVRLSEHELNAYMGTPWWWTAASPAVLPEAAAGDAGIEFWRGVCAGLCVGAHGRLVHVMEVDLRRGVIDGGNPANNNGGASSTNTSRCSCFGGGTQQSSQQHAPPSDADLLQGFFSTSKRVPNAFAAVGTVMEPLRRYINTYAVQRAPWSARYASTIGTTIYYASAFTAGYFPDFTNPDPTNAISILANVQGVADSNACLDECARTTTTNATSSAFVWYKSSDSRCVCSAENVLHFANLGKVAFSSALMHDVEAFAIEVCPGVASGSEHAFVYDKASGKVCPGAPLSAGYALAESVLMADSETATASTNSNSSTFSSSSSLSDADCFARCDALPTCAYAHAFVNTFEVYGLAHALPPPPDPPQSPPPPPPQHPPLPPFPPLQPPSNTVGLRQWSPSVAAGQAPRADPSDGAYHLRCGTSTCFSASFHSVLSPLAALETARLMESQGTFRDSLCPYECKRTIRSHELPQSKQLSVLAGSGLSSEAIAYPGALEGGFSRFASSATATRRSGRNEPAPMLAMQHAVSLDACEAFFERHRLLAPHALWMLRAENDGDTDDGTLAAEERLGDCGLFLAARSRIDGELWMAFYEYAQHVLELGHVDSVAPRSELQIARVHIPLGTSRCSASSSRVCAFWSEFALDAPEAFSCRPTDDGNYYTPAEILHELATFRVAYPPPAPPPPAPPEVPPSPSPPPGELRCNAAAGPSTAHHKVAEVDAFGTVSLVQQKCWRWDSVNDWPPFYVHQDVYDSVDRCGGGARSRDVQWDAGLRQSLLAPELFDPLQQNNDDCPYEQRLDASLLTDAVRATLEDGRYCMDRMAINSENVLGTVCDVGTNVLSCGVQADLVVFGYGSMTHLPDGWCVSKQTNRPIKKSDGCCDGGPGAVGGCDVCYYGTHTSRCGLRRFAFEPERAGPDEPDDSCDTDVGRANNKVCEDGLYWSTFAPDNAPCAPNTDVSDCGWRHPKRMARIGVVAEDTCNVLCSDTATDARCSDTTCMDASDDAMTTFPARFSDGTGPCGRGTHTRHCQTVADAKVAGATAGSAAYNDHRYRDKTIYINPSNAAVGTARCTVPENVFARPVAGSGGGDFDLSYLDFSPGGGSFSAVAWLTADGAKTIDALRSKLADEVCSDGGEGSVRVPFVASGASGSVVDDGNQIHPHVFHDFACPYGSQPTACPPRDLTVFQKAQDELQQPSGPTYKSCFDDGVADYECCHAENAFRVRGGPGVLGQRDIERPYYCASPLNSTSSDGEPCPTHYTAYHSASTGCKAYCNGAFLREGDDDACLPVAPECANWLSASAFPTDETLSVNTHCICGAKLPELIEAGDYVNKGTILSTQFGDGPRVASSSTTTTTAPRRQLQSSSSSSSSSYDGDGEPWRWPEPVDVGIDAFHGGHFDLSEQCFKEAVEFRTKHIVATAGTCGADYVALLAPHEPLATLGYDPDSQSPTMINVSASSPLVELKQCNDEPDGEACCIAHRSGVAMSRIWFASGGFDQASAEQSFGNSRVVGLAVHASQVSAVGNFNNDDAPDIVIGNRLFLNTDADFAYQEGVLIGNREFAQVYAGDVDGEAPDDIVAVYETGEVEIFIGLYDNASVHLSKSNGVGFRSAGIVLAAGVATVTTVSFVGTLGGYGTTCRKKRFGCTSRERAVFVGTLDTDDYIFVSPLVGAEFLNFSVSFSPLHNTKHATLCSTTFYADYAQRHQAIAIGTSEASPNSIAYLGVRGFEERAFGTEPYYERSVAVAADRVSDGANLICFANDGASNRCFHVPLDPEMLRSNQVITDLGNAEEALSRSARSLQNVDDGDGGAEYETYECNYEQVLGYEVRIIINSIIIS